MTVPCVSGMCLKGIASTPSQFAAAMTQELPSKAAALRCPDDLTILEAVAVHGSAAHTCGRCRGIWLTPELLRALSRSPRTSGWIGYVPWMPGASLTRICPFDGEPLTSFSGFGAEVVSKCPVCCGLWLAGELLQAHQHRILRTQAMDLTVNPADRETDDSATPDEGLIGPASRRVGLDPESADQFLMGCAALWLHEPWQ